MHIKLWDGDQIKHNLEKSQTTMRVSDYKSKNFIIGVPNRGKFLSHRKHGNIL